MQNFEVKNMSVKINERNILSNINLNLQNSQIYGVLGQEKSGKTLLINSLARKIESYEIKPNISYDSFGFTAAILSTKQLLPQSTAVNNMRILSNQKDNLSDEDINWFLEKVGLNPNDKRMIASYSKIEKILVAGALVLSENPNVIMIDDPFSQTVNLDEKLVLRLFQKLATMNVSVLITGNNEEQLKKICQQIFQLENGKLELLISFDD